MAQVTHYLTIAVLGSWLIGSFSHKMIGVEMINAVQTMAIALIFAPSYYPTLDRMNGLSQAIGGFQNTISNNTFLEYPQEYERMHFSADFKCNNTLVLAIYFLSLILYGVIVAI